MVVLGIGADCACVVEPVISQPGLAGPGGIVNGRTVDVDLHTDDTVANLGKAVAAALASVRRRRGICHGCRRYPPVQRWEGTTQRYCTRCISSYFGVNFRLSGNGRSPAHQWAPHLATA